MTRVEYEKAISNIAANYGTRLEKIHIDTIWMEFHRLPFEQFEKIVFLVLKNNKFSPRLAEFVLAAKELKEWELSQSRNAAFKALPDPTVPFFPSDEWVDAENEKLSLEHPNWDFVQIRKTMISMRSAMKLKHEEFTNMSRSNAQKRP